ncbi:cc15b222-5c62-4af8-ab66-887c063621b7 [Thermothielavioides terrestris]|uniref:Cc15b222-5c62-4af8-ab66-887c063621b7 n=1 Tax=Thermothielavioides terrestris TaxID=2587410 RepID=A0A3S4C7T8_9PEZI|nr:cc15b222-5c62-4af8-ab66-887c063621b7 [Thermothielavioides terrestris]
MSTTPELTYPSPFSSAVVDERTNIAYVKVFQIFSIWFVPFHRAPVRLVSVLHLAPGPAPSSEETITPPPPYDAAQEKRQAVQEGTKPSYAAVTTGQAAPASTSTTSSQQQQQGGEGPKRYYIQKQEDLYQVTEFVKFVALRPGAAVVGFWQLIATLMCLVGAVLLSPLVRAPWQAVRAPWPAAGAVKEKAMKAKTT